MPDASKYDLAFKPESYWDSEAPVKAFLARIKGERRRQWVLSRLREGKADEVEAWMLAEGLSEDMREFLGRIHPQFMSGEYLPDHERDEIEIARIALEATNGDIISIRARREEDGRIRYRIVDEYAIRCRCKFRFKPTDSSRPLTMGELISLIDHASEDGMKDIRSRARSLPECYRMLNLAEGADETEEYINELAHFAVVESYFYPELEAYYREEASEWRVQALEHKLRANLEDALFEASVSINLPGYSESWNHALTRIFGDPTVPPSLADFLDIGLWDKTLVRIWQRSNNAGLMLRMLTRCGDLVHDERIRVFACRTARRAVHLTNSLEFAEAISAISEYAESSGSWAEASAAGATIPPPQYRYRASFFNYVSEPDDVIRYLSHHDVARAAQIAAESAVRSLFSGDPLQAAARALHYTALALALADGRDAPDPATLATCADDLRTLFGNPLAIQHMRLNPQVFLNAGAAWEQARDPQTLLRLLIRAGYEDRATLRLFACWCGRQAQLMIGAEQPWRTVLDRAEEFARGATTWLHMKEALLHGLREVRGVVADNVDQQAGAPDLASRLLALSAIVWAGCNSEWAAAWYASIEGAAAADAVSPKHIGVVKAQQAAELRRMVRGVPPRRDAATRKSLLAAEIRRILWGVTW